MVKILTFILLFFSPTTILSQPDTLFVEFNNLNIVDYELSSLSEISFTILTNDSLVIKIGNQTKDIYLIDGLKQLTFSNQPIKTVPVELINFTGEYFENNIIFNWKTASENINYGFEIQRKLDNNWISICFINGNGTTTVEHNYSFNFSFKETKGEFRLKQIDTNGLFRYSKSIFIYSNKNTFTVDNNYPNPFNPITSIKYYLPEKGKLKINIYDINGKDILTLHNALSSEGSHTIVWDGKSFDGHSVSSGVYFIVLYYRNNIVTRKITLLK